MSNAFRDARVEDDVYMSMILLSHMLKIKAKFCSQFDLTDIGALEHFLKYTHCKYD